MRTEISPDDEGKDVVNAEGDPVGMVVEVSGETAYVDPDPGIAESIMAPLGWTDRSEDTYPLRSRSIAEITDEEIRLRSDL